MISFSDKLFSCNNMQDMLEILPGDRDGLLKILRLLGYRYNGKKYPADIAAFICKETIRRKNRHSCFNPNGIDNSKIIQETA